MWEHARCKGPTALLFRTGHVARVWLLGSMFLTPRIQHVHFNCPFSLHTPVPLNIHFYTALPTWCCCGPVAQSTSRALNTKLMRIVGTMGSWSAPWRPTMLSFFAVWHLACHIDILELIILRLICKGQILLRMHMANAMCKCFSMKKEDSLGHTNASAICSHFSMQDEYTLQHTNAKFHPCTLVVNL